MRKKPALLTFIYDRWKYSIVFDVCPADIRNPEPEARISDIVSGITTKKAALSRGFLLEQPTKGRKGENALLQKSKKGCPKTL
jgi:hypothetical protein